MLKYVGFVACLLMLTAFVWVAGSFGICFSTDCGSSLMAFASGSSGYATASVYASSSIDPDGYYHVWSSTSSVNAYDSGTYNTSGNFSKSNGASGGTGYFASAYINGDYSGLSCEACDIDS